MSPLPPVSHCSASAKTFIDTEKSRRHSGRRRSLRSHRKSMEKSQTKKKAMMDSCHFCVGMSLQVHFKPSGLFLRDLGDFF